jgi:glycosyltransferase involved in cell wall biosynthesis
MTNNLISIIIPTIGRSAQLEALLHSITCSNYKNYEIIIIDQNQTGMIDDIIIKYGDITPIHHAKVNFVGAARARNHGLQFANGNFLFFPDDDAELFPETLSLFIEYSKKTGADVLFGRCVDHTSADSAGTFAKKGGYLSLRRHLHMFIESTMCLKKETFLEFPFDESFGVGTFHGAEEAYDLVLRMLHKNVTIYYTPDVKIYHPHKVIDHSDQAEIRRAFSYRCGFAHLCAKHKLYKKYFIRLIQVLLYIPYTMIFASKKTRYYLSELMGLLTGMVVR